MAERFSVKRWFRDATVEEIRIDPINGEFGNARIILKNNKAVNFPHVERLVLSFQCDAATGSANRQMRYDIPNTNPFYAGKVGSYDVEIRITEENEKIERVIRLVGEINRIIRDSNLDYVYPICELSKTLKALETMGHVLPEPIVSNLVLSRNENNYRAG